MNNVINEQEYDPCKTPSAGDVYEMIHGHRFEESPEFNRKQWWYIELSFWGKCVACGYRFLSSKEVHEKCNKWYHEHSDREPGYSFKPVTSKEVENA